VFQSPRPVSRGLHAQLRAARHDLTLQSLHHLSSPLRIFGRGDLQHIVSAAASHPYRCLLLVFPPSCRAIFIAPKLCPRNPALCLPSSDHASPHFSSLGAARMRSIASRAAIFCSTLLSPSPSSLLTPFRIVTSRHSLVRSLTRGHHGKQLPAVIVYRLPPVTISRPPLRFRASKQSVRPVHAGLTTHSSTPLSCTDLGSYTLLKSSA
jgi:hypothetical protein